MTAVPGSGIAAVADKMGTRFPSSYDALANSFDGDIDITLGADGSVHVEDGGEEEADDKPAYLRHDFSENLAKHLLHMELQSLAVQIQEGIDDDLNSRKEWEEVSRKLVEYLGLSRLGEGLRSNLGSSLSQIQDPLLATATVKFWAQALAEFCPAAGPAKVTNSEPPPVAFGPGIGHNGGPPLMEASVPGAGEVTPDDLAEAFEKDFNHYLTDQDRTYYRDFSRMLLSLGPIGTQFRKVFFDPFLKKPVSRWVRANDLVVSSDAVDLETAQRVTHLIKMSQADAKRLQISGWWRQCDLTTPVEQVSEYDRTIGDAEGITRNPIRSEDHQHLIQECYTELDLPGFEHTDEDPESETYGQPTGIPLPYRVTIEKTSGQIVEIRRNWREDDENFRARQRFVMFGMVPGLGFYCMGFMHLLGNGVQLLTSLDRMLLDAGIFENFPAFLKKKGAVAGEISSDIRLSPGQAAEIDCGNDPLQAAIMNLPYKGPSAALIQIAAAMLGRFEELAGAANLPVGEGTANIPVGTIMAMVEESTKIVSAVHKGLHISRAEELELLRELIAEDPSVLWRFRRRGNPARKWEQAEEFANLDLVPSSDPNVPSQIHRIMQATALAQLVTTLPQAGLDPKWVVRDVCRTIGKELPDDAFMPPQQGGPPPESPAKMMLAEAALQNAQTNAAKLQQGGTLAAQETQRKAAEAVTQSETAQQEAAAKAAQHASDLALRERTAAMQAETERQKLALETGKALHGASLAERQHAHQVQQSQMQPPAGIAPKRSDGGPL